MKQLIFFKKTLLFAVLFPLHAIAIDFKVGDLYYNILSDNTVEVTQRSQLSGDIVVPETVTHGDRTYIVTAIGDGAFIYCSDLTSVKLPPTIKSIGYRAFFECTNLASIQLPMNIETIEEGAFEECTSLREIELPEKLTYLGDNAFMACYNLMSVIFHSGLTTLGEDVFWKCGLTSVVLPEGLTTIGNGAFIFCENLSSVTFPNSLSSIGQQSFDGCNSLTSIILPKNVKFIGDFAFGGTNITSLYCKAVTPPSCEREILNISQYDKCTLYVPENSEKKYSEIFPWSEFGRIESLSVTGIGHIDVSENSKET